MSNQVVSTNRLPPQSPSPLRGSTPPSPLRIGTPPSPSPLRCTPPSPCPLRLPPGGAAAVNEPLYTAVIKHGRPVLPGLIGGTGGGDASSFVRGASPCGRGATGHISQGPHPGSRCPGSSPYQGLTRGQRVLGSSPNQSQVYKACYKIRINHTL